MADIGNAHRINANKNIDHLLNITIDNTVDPNTRVTQGANEKDLNIIIYKMTELTMTRRLSKSSKKI